MIYNYNRGQQADPLYTEHKEMILSWETFGYQWIIAEVFHSDEEFANLPYSFVWLVCLINTGLVKKNDALRNIHLISFCDSSTRSFFRETTIYGIEIVIG